MARINQHIAAISVVMSRPLLDVPLQAGLRGLGTDERGLRGGDDLDPARGDSSRDERLADSDGPLLPHRRVLFHGLPLVEIAAEAQGGLELVL